MRLIDAEYLLYGMAIFSKRENGAEFMKGVDAVADMIESAETISPADNWTPCSVALPDERKVCLVTYACGEQKYISISQFTNKKYGWSGFIDKGDSVLAWQPLPEPYRGEA